jgi:hypothetical protein
MTSISDNSNLCVLTISSRRVFRSTERCS